MNVKSLLLLATILLSGCAMLPDPWTTLTNPPSDFTKTFNIKVTSEPSDAEIYVNNMLMGRTPAKDIPVTVPYKQVERLLWAAELAKEGPPVLRVSKPGYKDVAVPLLLENLSQGVTGGRYDYMGLNLKEYEYHLKLEKRENVE